MLDWHSCQICYPLEIMLLLLLLLLLLEILGEAVRIIRIIIIIRIRHWYHLCLLFVHFKLEPSYDLNMLELKNE